LVSFFFAATTVTALYREHHSNCKI